MIKLGFTGTQHGMTDIQAQVVFNELMLYGQVPEQVVTEVHHGCCVGADAQFHDMLAYMPKDVVVHGHPPVITTKMAHCQCDVMHEPLDYLVRNRAIVDASNTLFAAPQGEEELRSGTWSTVRYARRKGRINIMIIMPDGGSRFERHRGVFE